MDYRVDDLARAAGTTVRNVRAYQDRGLLQPPRREGRTGWYDDGHLARLRLIAHMLERGYTLQNIAELIQAWERGHDVSDLLGLEAALASPFTDEVAATFSPAELAELFGSVPEPEVLADAVDLGLISYEDGQFKAASPRLLRAGAELHRAGVPLTELFEQVRRLRRDVDRIAARFVELVAGHVFGRYGDALPPAEDLPDLVHTVRRLRPLAEMVVDAELARALERHAQRLLGDHLAHLLDQERADAAG